MCTYVFVYQRVWLVVCYNISDWLGRSELGNERSGFVSVVDPIHRRFEERSMWWSVD